MISVLGPPNARGRLGASWPRLGSFRARGLADTAHSVTDSSSIRALFWEASAIRETLRPQAADNPPVYLIDGKVETGTLEVETMRSRGAVRRGDSLEDPVIGYA